MKKLLSFVLAAILVVSCIGLISFADGVLYGDVNNDDFVNKKDDLAMRKYLADDSYEIDLEAANVFYDSAVNKKDLLRLKQYLADPDITLGPDTTPTPEVTPEPTPTPTPVPATPTPPQGPDGSFDLPEDLT